jgi:hypothetical protein
MATTIFISYRRTDAAGHAGRLYDRLVQQFGEENVWASVYVDGEPVHLESPGPLPPEAWPK